MPNPNTTNTSQYIKSEMQPGYCFIGFNCCICWTIANILWVTVILHHNMMVLDGVMITWCAWLKLCKQHMHIYKVDITPYRCDIYCNIWVVCVYCEYTYMHVSCMWTGHYRQLSKIMCCRITSSIHEACMLFMLNNVVWTVRFVGHDR